MRSGVFPRVAAMALSATLASSVGMAAPGVIEEVVVTAQKREQTLMEVPQSVQAFSGEFIEEMGIYNLVDAVNFIPGASASFSGGAGSQLYNLRGTGAQGRIGQLAIGFYIDDIPWIGGGPFGPPIELFDLESLEVLRGPQGTLYGEGSMGGTFVITTARPDLQNFTARGRLIASDMREGERSYGIDGTVSMPLVRDQLALRLTGGATKGAGLAESDDFPGTDIDDFDQWDLRAKLLWEASEALSVQATYWHTKEDRNFSPGIYGSVDPPMIFGTGGIPGRAVQETILSSLLVDWDTPYGRLTSATSYVDNDGLFDAAFAFDTFIPGAGLINAVLQLTVPAESQSFSQEFRFASTADGPLQWIVGAQYTDSDASNEVLSAFVAGPDFLTSLPPFVGTGASESRRWSVFGEVSREFMDGLLTPLLGLRYFEDRQKFDAVSEAGDVFSARETFDAVSPRFNLRIQPADSTQIYLNVAKGFRSGVFNTTTQIQNAALLGITVQPTLDESVLWSYEIGGRLRLLGGRLQVEPAIYHVVYEDYQFEGSAGNVNFALPIEEVKGTGADLLVRYLTPIDGLVLSLTADVNETEPTKIAADFTATQASLAEDEQMPFVPRWSYSAAAQYERPFGDRGLIGFGSAIWFERDRQVDFITGLESARIEDLTLRLGVRRDNWSVTLWGENLTDEVGPAVIAGGLPNRYDRRRFGITISASTE
jgi:iron complex outermembrane recepter protein